MSTALWVWSHVSTALLAAQVLLPLRRRISRPTTRILFYVALAGLTVLPLQHTDLSGCVLGHLGVLSASTVILLLHAILVQQNCAGPLSPHEKQTADLLILVAGTSLYTSALGFVAIDIYASGYTVQMPWIVLAASVLLALFRQWILAVCLVGAVMAHNFRIGESADLWDYLIDPWLFFAATLQLFRHAIRQKSLPRKTAAALPPAI